MRAYILGLVAVSTLAMAKPALAQSSEDLAAAERLFRDAKELMNQQQYARACPMFAESARLDQQPGTLLNLGLCYEASNKTASAWGAFSQAAIDATRKGQQERAQFAKEHAAALEPKLSLVKFAITNPAPQETIKLDGRSVGDGSLVTSLPLDPGHHALEAVAPGKLPKKMTFEVPEGPASQEVTVEGLIDAPPAPPTTIIMAPTEKPDDGSGRRMLGYIVGGVGVAGLATGTIFGLLYLNKAHENNNSCTGDPPTTNGALCTPGQVSDAQDTRSTAKTFSTVSAVGLGVGVVGVGVGAYLILTAKPAKKEKDGPPPPANTHATLRVVPDIGLTTRGVALSGTF